MKEGEKVKWRDQRKKECCKGRGVKIGSKEEGIT